MQKPQSTSIQFYEQQIFNIVEMNESDGEDRQEIEEIQDDEIEFSSIVIMPTLHIEKQPNTAAQRKAHIAIIIVFFILLLAVAGYYAFDDYPNINPPNYAPTEVESAKIKKDAEQTKSYEQHVAELKTVTPKAVEPQPTPPPPAERPTEKTDKDYIPFDVPKVVWRFEERTTNYLQELRVKNHFHFAQQSGFEVVTVNRQNFTTMLSAGGAEAVNRLLQALSGRQNEGSLRFHLEGIAREVILLNLLRERGGVLLNGNLPLTEDFGWLETIAKNPYVNRGNRGAAPRVAGFYVPYYSSPFEKQNIKAFAGMHEVDRFMSALPSPEKYFLAAEKETAFLRDLTAKIELLLLNPEQSQRERSKYRFFNFGGDLYNEYFLMASQMVLQDAQKQIDAESQKAKEGFSRFAVDHYGLNLINCHYGPFKLKIFWMDNRPQKIFQSLTQYSLVEFEAHVGPMRYLTNLNFEREMSFYLEMTRDGKRKPILKGSFIQYLFYPEYNQSFLIENPEKPFVNGTMQEWTTLPRILWVFWDTGLKNSLITNQLCVENLRRMSALSGFKVIEVNVSNAGDYIDAKTLERIDNVLKNHKIQMYKQSPSDLYRLALVSKHGGIYLDASYFLFESFDWLLQIGRYPSEFIFNRFGNLPKVVMMWHPFYASPFDWVVKNNTKKQWELALESNFIAAEAGNEFVTQWFDTLLDLYMKPYHEVENELRKCQTYENKWISTYDQYLLVMDSVKCVLGRKELQIKKEGLQWENAAHYFGVWSMSGYIGQQKLRTNTNYQWPGEHNNPFLFRYSQNYTENLLGRIRHFTKFYALHTGKVADWVAQHMNRPFEEDAHPDSYFMKYLWRKEFKIEGPQHKPYLKVPS